MKNLTIVISLLFALLFTNTVLYTQSKSDTNNKPKTVTVNKPMVTWDTTYINYNSKGYQSTTNAKYALLFQGTDMGKIYITYVTVVKNTLHPDIQKTNSVQFEYPETIKVINCKKHTFNVISVDENSITFTIEK